MNIQTYTLLTEDISYDNFRSEISHMLKNKGDYEFAKEILKYNFVKVYWEKEWYIKAYYVLAILDYFTEKYELKPLEMYNKYRKYKLNDLIFPPEVNFLDKIEKSNKNKEAAIVDCSNHEIGKYFFKYNIVEEDIYNAI